MSNVHKRQKQAKNIRAFDIRVAPALLRQRLVELS